MRNGKLSQREQRIYKMLCDLKPYLTLEDEDLPTDNLRLTVASRIRDDYRGIKIKPYKRPWD